MAALQTAQKVKYSPRAPDRSTRPVGARHVPCDSAGMATIHRTTMVPGKLDLLEGMASDAAVVPDDGQASSPEPGRWVPARRPRGQVGIEFFFVTDGTDGEDDVLRPVDLPRHSAGRGGAGAARYVGARRARPAMDLRRRTRPGGGHPAARVHRGAGSRRRTRTAATPPTPRSSGARHPAVGWQRPDRSGCATRTPGSPPSPSSWPIRRRRRASRRPCISSACWTAAPRGRGRSRLVEAGWTRSRRLHRSRPGGVGPVAGRPATGVGGPRTGRRACRPPRAAGAGRAAWLGQRRVEEAWPPTRAGAIDRASSPTTPTLSAARSRDGPPSHSTCSWPSSASASSAVGRSTSSSPHTRTVTPASVSAPRRANIGRRAGDQDRGGVALRGQGAGRVERGPSGDDGDRRGRRPPERGPQPATADSAGSARSPRPTRCRAPRAPRRPERAGR